MRGKHFKKKSKPLKFLVFLSSVLLLILVGVVISTFLKEADKTAVKTSTQTAGSISSTSLDEEQMELKTKETNDPTTKNKLPVNYQNLSKTITSPESQELESQLKAQNFVGTALIVKDNQILLQKGYGFADIKAQKPNVATSHFQIGSIQKSMTATLIMRAIAEKKLALETPLSTYYPQIANANSITIDQILHMRSGIKVNGQPSVVDEQAIIDYTATHAYIENSGVYNYSPPSFVLLAGILNQLYHKSYYQLFRETFGEKFDFKHYGFYQDWPQRANNTTSYHPNKTNPYQSVITENPQEFARELGTGNVDMTAGDLFWYFRLLLNGRFYPNELLTRLEQVEGNSNYVGGFYLYPTYNRAHGSEEGQEVFVYFTNDMKNAVVLLTNTAGFCQLENLTKTLFQTTTNIVTK